MKKIILSVFVFILSLTVISCDAFTITTGDELTTEITTTQNLTTENETTVDSTEALTTEEMTTEILTTENISTEEPTTLEPTTEEPTTVAPTTEEPTTVAPTTEEPTTEEPTTIAPTTEPTTTETPTTDVYEPFVPTGYSLLQDELDTYGIPSTGDVKILVFLVDFPDYEVNGSSPSYQDINTAFNGESSALGFESVNSYFSLVSNGALNLTADVFGYYTANENSNYYLQESNNGDYPESDIITEVMNYYDSQIDYSEYDSNDDGFIDGVYIIYNHPIDSNTDLWWAYQWNYAYYTQFDGMDVDYFVWASNDFIYEDGEDINARTYIHETGHMMGLDDYYDYDGDSDSNDNVGGLGTYMMDYTIGDEDPLSKLLLGWIQPIVIEGSVTLDLLPHLESGQVLLIINEWNNTIFDEYLLITYFTPEGINDSNTGKIFTESGINIFHVSAQLDYNYDYNSSYPTMFEYNNSDTVYKLIDIVEADMDESIEAYEVVENSDLFQSGDILNQNVYSGFEWYTGQPLGFIVSIDSITTEKATLTIIFE